jgi:hypothetical protein
MSGTPDQSTRPWRVDGGQLAEELWGLPQRTTRELSAGGSRSATHVVTRRQARLAVQGDARSATLWQPGLLVDGERRRDRV